MAIYKRGKRPQKQPTLSTPRPHPPKLWESTALKLSPQHRALCYWQPRQTKMAAHPLGRALVLLPLMGLQILQGSGERQPGLLAPGSRLCSRDRACPTVKRGREVLSHSFHGSSLGGRGRLASRGRDLAMASTQDLESESRPGPCKAEPGSLCQPPMAWGPTWSQELGIRVGTGQSWEGPASLGGLLCPGWPDMGQLGQLEGLEDRHLENCGPHLLAAPGLSPLSRQP